MEFYLLLCLSLIGTWGIEGIGGNSINDVMSLIKELKENMTVVQDELHHVKLENKKLVDATRKPIGKARFTDIQKGEGKMSAASGSMRRGRNIGNGVIQREIDALKESVRQLGDDIYEDRQALKEAVMKQNAEVTQVKHWLQDMGDRQLFAIKSLSNMTLTVQRRLLDGIWKLRRKEISDVEKLTEWLHAIESRHRQEINNIVEKMYAAIRQKGTYAARFSDVDVRREGGTYQISANINVYDSGWYQVCGEGFTNQAANVFCKMGGFSRGTLQHKDIKWRDVGKAETRSGYYYTFACEGSETSLQDCTSEYTSSQCEANISNVKCYT